MPVTKPIIQRFLKGLNSVADIFSQPEGIVADLQQLLLNFIGGLVSCDAMVETGVIVTPDKVHPATGNIFGLGIFSPDLVDGSGNPFNPPVNNDFQIFEYLARQTGVQLVSPTGLTTTDLTIAGGVLVPGTTYSYYVTAIDNDFTLPYGTAGETVGTNITRVLGAGHNALQINWAMVPGAAGYRIYGRLVGTEKLFVGGPLTVDANTLTFTDNGVTGLTAISPPGANTTNLTTSWCRSYFFPNAPFQVQLLPFSKISTVSGPFGTINPGSDIRGFTPSGGIRGLSGPLPQFVPCPNLNILCLGNGIFPWYENLTSIISGENGLAGAAPLTGGNIPVAIAHGLFHAGFFWACNTWIVNHANGLDGPSALRQSNVNDPTTYNVANSTFVGKGDGDEITAVCAFSIAEAGIAPAGNVVIYKNYSTWVAAPLLISNSGFTLNQAQTDMGCVAPRTPQYIAPLGMFRLTHKGIAVFDGLRDKLLTGDVIQNIFDNRDGSGQNLDWSYAYLSRGFYVNDPPMYCMLYPKVGGEGANGQMSGLLCYDLQAQAFTKVNLLVNGLGAGGHYSCAFTVLSPGAQPTTIFASSGNGKTYRWQDKSTVDPNGNPVFFLLTTAEVFNAESPSDPVYIKSLTIKGKGTGSITTVTLSINGGASTITLGSSQLPSQSYAGVGGDWQVEIEVGQTVMNINATISGNGPITIHLIKWDVTAKESGRYVIA